MTNDSALYFAVGWLIVFVFAATAVITLCALLGVVKLKEGYLRILFAKLILEVIAASFFLFYQGPRTRYAELVHKYETLVPDTILIYGPQVDVTNYEISPPGTGESAAECPKGWLFVQGGIGPQPSYTPFEVVKSERTANGIQIVARNHAGGDRGPQPLMAHALCSRPPVEKD